MIPIEERNPAGAAPRRSRSRLVVGALLRGALAGAPLAGAAAAASTPQDIVIENAACRMSLSPRGAWRALVDKRSGEDWAWAGGDIRLVDARVGGRTLRPDRVTLEGERLTVAFDSPGTTLVYDVRVAPEWIVFALREVSGVRPSHLTVARVPTTVAGRVGRLLNIARSDDVAVCLLSANLQSTGAARSRGAWSELAVTTQDGPPGPRLEGAAAALLLSPAEEIRAVLSRATTAFGLPSNARDGIPSRESPVARGSYWFLNFGADEIDAVIDCCRRTGFRQVLLPFGAWSSAAGHYPINTRSFPGGIEGLKAAIDRLHGEGILVGMHTFASKVAKSDAYVTPVPDRRFWCDRESALAAAVDVAATEIRVAGSLAEWPGSPASRQKDWEGGVRKHCDVILDDEIVRYESIGPEGCYDTFLGCRRGAYGTAAAAHGAGARARHLGVDGCIDGYIIDQDTDLIDEVTDRLAAVFNRCGFDMVYFDGGEDVDRRRFDYFVTRNQAMAMAKFARRPMIHMGTCITHGLSQSFTRSGTADTYPNTYRGAMIASGCGAEFERTREIVDGIVRRAVAYRASGQTRRWPTVKEHIDRSVERALELERSLLPAELGWFGIWPADAYGDGLQLDEVEYLMVKSLAYDLPVSFQTTFRQMDAHPLTPQILEIARVYEETRRDGPRPDAATRARLRELRRDFVRVLQDGGAPEFVEVREVPDAAGAADRVRAFVGAGGDGWSVATVWHVARDGELTLAIEPALVKAADFLGQPIALRGAGARVIVPVNGWRTTLTFSGVTPQDAGCLLERGAFRERPRARVWLQAEAYARSEGPVGRGRDVGGSGAHPIGDVVSREAGKERGKSGAWFCEYTVELPAARSWNVWARVRYPSGSDDSFWFVPGPGPAEHPSRSVLGNCGAAGKAWHWTGSGGGLKDLPPGRPIGLRHAGGTFTFRIYEREGGASVERAPRIDCICFAEDPAYVPTDADARAAMSR